MSLACALRLHGGHRRGVNSGGVTRTTRTSADKSGKRNADTAGDTNCSARQRLKSTRLLVVAMQKSSVVNSARKEQQKKGTRTKQGEQQRKLQKQRAVVQRRDGPRPTIPQLAAKQSALVRVVRVIRVLPFSPRPQDRNLQPPEPNSKDSQPSKGCVYCRRECLTI